MGGRVTLIGVLVFIHEPWRDGGRGRGRNFAPIGRYKTACFAWDGTNICCGRRRRRRGGRLETEGG